MRLKILTTKVTKASSFQAVQKHKKAFGVLLLAPERSICRPTRPNFSCIFFFNIWIEDTAPPLCCILYDHSARTPLGGSMKGGKTEKKKRKSQKKAKNPAKIPVGGGQNSSFGQKKPLFCSSQGTLPCATVSYVFVQYAPGFFVYRSILPAKRGCSTCCQWWESAGFFGSVFR